MVAEGEEVSWWDLPYADEVGQEGVRFLRLHAAPVCVPPGGVHATVVVIHGGYWKNKFGLDDPYGNAGTASLAPFFRERGFAAVELEYRRRDHVGGGWPGTNQDILMALQRLNDFCDEDTSTPRERSDALACAINALRSDRLMLIGHSSGGCLALWAGHQLSERAAPLVLAAAPVADLVEGHRMQVSDEGDAVELYMKCLPEDDGGEYAKASPAALLPVTFPVLVAYGDNDADLPPALVSGYCDSARSGSPDLVREVKIPGADHFDIVNAGSSAWLEHIVPALAVMIGARWSSEAADALLGSP